MKEISINNKNNHKNLALRDDFNDSPFNALRINYENGSSFFYFVYGYELCDNKISAHVDCFNEKRPLDYQYPFKCFSFFNFNELLENLINSVVSENEKINKINYNLLKEASKKGANFIFKEIEKLKKYCIENNKESACFEKVKSS